MRGERAAADGKKGLSHEAILLRYLARKIFLQAGYRGKCLRAAVPLMIPGASCHIFLQPLKRVSDSRLKAIMSNTSLPFSDTVYFQGGRCNGRNH